MWVLDLGCGTGVLRIGGSIPPGSSVLGVDLNHGSCVVARRCPGGDSAHYVCARGEQIPLSGQSVDMVVSNVALPYMDIPRTLDEIHRVLVPGGTLRLSMHHPLFTLAEFANCWNNPKATLYRVWVLLNGLIFHVTGRVVSLAGKPESCQTERGMQLSLQRAGFQDVRCRRKRTRFLVEARKGSRGVGQAQAAAA